MRGAKVKVKCKRCKCEFEARVADRKRGWGKFCSKSCKASEQEGRTGQMASYLERKDSDYGDIDCGHMMQSGYFGHGQD